MIVAIVGMVGIVLSVLLGAVAVAVTTWVFFQWKRKQLKIKPMPRDQQASDVAMCERSRL